MLPLSFTDYFIYSYSTSFINSQGTLFIYYTPPPSFLHRSPYSFISLMFCLLHSYTGHFLQLFMLHFLPSFFTSFIHIPPSSFIHRPPPLFIHTSPPPFIHILPTSFIHRLSPSFTLVFDVLHLFILNLLCSFTDYFLNSLLLHFHLSQMTFFTHFLYAPHSSFIPILPSLLFSFIFSLPLLFMFYFHLFLHHILCLPNGFFILREITFHSIVQKEITKLDIRCYTKMNLELLIQWC